MDENGSPYIPRHVTPEASALILWKDDKRVAYLVYDVSYKVGQVEIRYIMSTPPIRERDMLLS